MKSFKLANTLFITGIMLATSLNSHAITIKDNGNSKQVGQVKWQKTEQQDIQKLINQSTPNNAGRLIFLRQLDKDSLQTSANIAINDRFQVSLQPGNYSQIYVCTGVNQISGDITGHKNNDLLKNITSFDIEPGVNYFFDINIDNNGNTNIEHITQDKALTLLNSMKYQTHQITRVVPNCPPAPELIAEPKGIVKATANYHNIQLNVLFDNDKADIKAQYHDEIKRVADFMNAHPEVTATIEGHTDSNASNQHNLKLSQHRVDAVKNILINNYGIASNRLNSIGYGESKPIADNSTAEGRQQNRRVIAVFQAN